MKIEVIDNENIYGEIRYKIIETKYHFEENIKKNKDTFEHAVIIVKKEYDEIIFYAKFNNMNVEEAYMSSCVNGSDKLKNDVSFFMNLTPLIFNKIYTYYLW